MKFVSECHKTSAGMTETEKSRRDFKKVKIRMKQFFFFGTECVSPATSEC